MPDEIFTYNFPEAEYVRNYPYNESVTMNSGGGLTQEEIGRIRRAVMSARSLWVHVDSAIGIMYFNLGGMHSAWLSGVKRPWPEDWSLTQGWVRPGELRSSFMEHAADYPAAIREWREREDMGWVYERYRGMIAQVLNESAASVVFGGEATAEGLSPPAFHVYGPSVAWRYVINPHQDQVYWKDRVGTRECEPDLLLSFSLTVSMPSDGGFFFWDSRGRHKHSRPEGELISWGGTVAHALAPWSMPWYSDPNPFRITVQGFGLTCGGIWYVYH
mmetsp:Transcript_14994/g.44389  ORF Transcript_14994/g.44389 Transcript_14994/m.44389 type:complete len:273 (-) Transcript_14994:119-937(-)